MFCTSLRKRPEWTSIIPPLLSSTAPKFQGQSALKRTLSTRDIAFPISASPSTTTTTTTTTNNQNNKPSNARPAHLYFLLLTPSSLHEPNRSQTLARIDRLSTLTGNTKDVGIVFLLSGPDSPKSATLTSPMPRAEGTHAFMELQLLTHTHLIPILPLPTPQSLLPTLNHYATTLTSHPSPSPSPFPSNLSHKTFTLTHLLSTTTTTYPPHPLPQHATNVLSDIVPSLRALAEMVGVGNERGRREVCRFVGEEVGAGVVEFWEGEWVVE